MAPDTDAPPVRRNVDPWTQISLALAASAVLLCLFTLALAFGVIAVPLHLLGLGLAMGSLRRQRRHPSQFDGRALTWSAMGLHMLALALHLFWWTVVVAFGIWTGVPLP